MPPGSTRPWQTSSACGRVACERPAPGDLVVEQCRRDPAGYSLVVLSLWATQIPMQMPNRAPVMKPMVVPKTAPIPSDSLAPIRKPAKLVPAADRKVINTAGIHFIDPALLGSEPA